MIFEIKFAHPRDEIRVYDKLYMNSSISIQREYFLCIFGTLVARANEITEIIIDPRFAGFVIFRGSADIIAYCGLRLRGRVSGVPDWWRTLTINIIFGTDSGVTLEFGLLSVNQFRRCRIISRVIFRRD